MQWVRVRRLWRMFIALAMVAMSLAGVPVAQAATTVSIANGDVASLAAAFVAANGGSPQVLSLASGGDYVLTTAIYDQLNVNYSGLPELTGNVTIQGNGATIERSSATGTPAFGVLDVGPGGSLKLDNVTITGGNNTTYYQSGGGIYNAGTLTVTNSTITGNTAPGAGGGIYNSYGTLTVTGTTISNNTSPSTAVNSAGGGIGNAGGTATVTNSTITGNSASYGGGGLGNTSGTMTVANSTVSSNSSTYFGGGFLNLAGATATIVNSTFFNNSGTAIYNSASALTLKNTTISGNTAGYGGGVLNTGGTLSAANNIVAGNTSPDAYGVTTDGGNNLIGADAGTSGLTNGVNGNLVGTVALPIDPMLSPIANNGGPTQTMALLAGSPAVDAGSDTVCSAIPVSGLDQRGYVRPAGAHCDIGAFEYGAVPPPNQPPTVAANQSSVSVNEGSTATNTGTVGDPDGDTVSLTASAGTVTNNNDGTWSWSFATSDGPSQSQLITITANDGQGGTTPTTFSLTVSNVAPTATFVVPVAAVDNGSPFALSLTSPQDPSSVDTTAGFSYAFDCGSGYGAFGSSSTATCTATTVPSQSVKAKIQDKDGGVTEYTGAVSVVIPDSIPPVTTPSAVNADTTPYTFGTWTNQDVTISLSAIDTGGSGLAGTFFTIDGAGLQTYSAPFTINTEGSHTVTFWSTDNAGNGEIVQSVGVLIDLTGPSISGAATTSPNANGWYNSAVTIHWTCSDSLSGLASCPPDQTISTEGANQTVSGTATDNAGNSTTVSSPAVNIDLTGPTNVIGTPDRAPDSNGWYNHPVTITFSGQDATSGILSCSSSTYSGPDSAAATVTGTCTDQAGNVSSGSVTLAYDATVPTITYTGNAGTYTIDQTVTITCSAIDNLSGIASTDCQNINAPAYTFATGVNTISSSATDNAGNIGTGSVTFTVGTTPDSLIALTQQFETNRGILHQLRASLEGVKLAEQLGNQHMKTALINTYIMEVNLQRGRTLTDLQADTLIALANAL